MKQIDSCRTFEALIRPLQRALAEEGYTTPTPIQKQAIPYLIQGRDLLGCAQTGTGKTAAFALPLLQYLSQNRRDARKRQPRILILTPTRELAAQIGESMAVYGRHLPTTHTVIFGGVSQYWQVKDLHRGVDIVVATPGRLLDLMQQRHIDLMHIEALVLDEADRMLDMGFIHDVRRIIKAVPGKRQSIFFSATMPPPVSSLAQTMLSNPVEITVEPEKPTVERIVHKVLFLDKRDKDALLASLLKDHALDKVLVFTRTKHGADKVAGKLLRARVSAQAIHGQKTQNARTRALAGFKRGDIRALVATDIAARGIDVDGITHVINYDLPLEAETYIHRVGRTARAGADGDAISFCSAQERDALRGIERLIKKRVPQDLDHDYHSETARQATGAAAKPPPRQQRPAGQRKARRYAG